MIDINYRQHRISVEHELEHTRTQWTKHKKIDAATAWCFLTLFIKFIQNKVACSHRNPAPCTSLLPTRSCHPTTERVVCPASTMTQRERRRRHLRDLLHRDQSTILALQDAPKTGSDLLAKNRKAS